MHLFCERRKCWPLPTNAGRRIVTRLKWMNKWKKERIPLSEIFDFSRLQRPLCLIWFEAGRLLKTGWILQVSGLKTVKYYKPVECYEPHFLLGLINCPVSRHLDLKVRKKTYSLSRSIRHNLINPKKKKKQAGLENKFII